MNCQLQYTPNCPLNKIGKTCNIECDKFTPFPPRMTDQEFAIKQKDILQVIPLEFHGALSYYAWEEGHAYGYEEVISHLQELVESLEQPIKDYTTRIKSS